MICVRCGNPRGPERRYCEECRVALRRISERKTYWKKQGWKSKRGPICRYCASLLTPEQMRSSRMCWECYYQRAAIRRREDPDGYRRRSREWRRAYRMTERGKASEAAAVRRYRAKHPDRYHKSQRDSRRKVLGDAKRRDRELVDRRILSRLNGRVSTDRVMPATSGYRAAPPGQHTKPMVPAAPLAAWLRREFVSWPTADLARWLGEDDSQLHRLMTGDQMWVSLHVADRIFVHADCTHLLALLYPDEAAA